MEPKWKFLANLGDVNPLDYGGFFVYVDETGTHDPQAEVLELDDESDDPRYTAYRFDLPRCTFINDILSDNPHHPGKPAWFADTKKLDVLTDGCREDDIIKSFCSEDPMERAQAWRLVGLYHGYDNLDSYPLKLRKREARKRYKEMNGIEYR